jgi:hypothetical protein
MSACKEQCPKSPRTHYKGTSFKWYKRQLNRLIRRMAKRDPEDAWKKHYYWGYYD